MAHNVETMAYAGEVPWHGLGVKVDSNLTPEQMLKAANLDWTVDKKQLWVGMGDGKADDDQLLHSHSALVRNTDSKVLGICGKDYVPTQNKESFEFFDRFCRAGDMTMETAGSLQEGRRVWALAKIKGGFRVNGGDEVEGFILLDSPHIWGKSLQIMFTPIRVVCNNTLTLALNNADINATFRMVHDQLFTAEIKKQAEEKVGLATAALDQFKNQSKFLASKRYNDQSLMRFFSQIMNPGLVLAENDEVNPDDLGRTAAKLVEIVDTQPGADMKTSKGTWWGAFNAVTYYYDHVAGVDRDKALTSAWFGAAANRKRTALDLAIEYAEAA
jgi:phage/plasmid-like protein (TIGR03299 family)